MDIGFFDIIFSLGSWKIKIIKLLDFLLGGLLARIVKAKKPLASLIQPTEIQKILIIRPGGMGDAIFLIPFLKLLRQSHRQAVVDILCEKRNNQIFLLENNLCDRIYLYDDPKSFGALFKNKYNIIIDTEQWHYLSALTACFLKPDIALGFATRALRAKLFNLKIPYEIHQYEIKNFQKLFAPLLKNVELVKDINSCLNVNRNPPLDIPPKTIALFIGASIVVRRLSNSQCLEIIHDLLKKDFHVALLGGKDVLKTAQKIEREINDKRLLSFVGKISLAESAAVIKRCRAFIGTDSGLLHLACAVGTPVVAIFGPGNLKKWAPQGESHAIITENVSCSPCTRFGYTVPTCQGSYHCMKNLRIQNILAYISSINTIK